MLFFDKQFLESLILKGEIMYKIYFWAFVFTMTSISYTMAQPVTQYGALSTNANQILSESATPVQLKGLSLGVLEADSRANEFYNANAISKMIDIWNAEVVKTSVLFKNTTDFLSNLDFYKDNADLAIKVAKAKKTYAILSVKATGAALDPDAVTALSEFFTYFANEYKDSPHLIFELLESNESSWTSLKSSQEALISAIRSVSEHFLILVGTPSFSKDLESALNKPIDAVNIAYTFQFSAGSESISDLSPNFNTYSDEITAFLQAGLPLFISKLSTVHSDGGLQSANHYNTHNPENANEWFSLLEAHSLSYVVSEFSDAYKASAFYGIKESPDFDQSVAANWSMLSLMTESGAYIFEHFTEKSPSSSSSTAKSSSSVAKSSSSVTKSSSSITPPSSSSQAPIFAIIDDFTDKNNQANTKEYWYIFTDKNDKGKSTVANEVSGNNYKLVLDDGTGNYAAVIEDFKLNQGASDNDPFVAIGLDTKKNGNTYDLSECVDGFSYKYKGVAHSFKAQLSTVKDYNYHFVSVANSTVWKTVSIQFSDFEQEDWGKTVAFNPAAITAFHWEVKASPLTGNLWVDDFYCLGSDLGLNPPQSSSSVLPASSSSTPPSSSSSTSPEISKSSSSVGPLLSIIDDFTDKNNQANTKEYWYIFTDKNDKGKSTVANEVSGNNYKLVLDDGTGNYAAAIESFILNKGASDNDPFVAIGLDTKKNGSTYNLSECVDGFSYKYKGVAHSFKAQLSTVKDYNYHFVSVANSTVWKTVSIQFSDFEQADWGKTVAFNPAAITAFHWEVKASPLTGNLWVDDFYCLGGDLGINPASSSSTSPKSSSSVTEPEDPTTIIAHSKLQELSVSFNNKTRQISLQNPSSDRIWVDIYDMQGNNIMFSKELKQSISLENIPNGNYLVRIRNTKNHRVFSIKLH